MGGYCNDSFGSFWIWIVVIIIIFVFFFNGSKNKRSCN